MIKKLVTYFAAVVVTKAQEQRSLAGGGGEAASSYDPHFEMHHATDEGYKYHYKNYGNDWTTIEGLADADNKCGSEDFQSPINVMQPIGSYGWAYGSALPKQDDSWS